MMMIVTGSEGHVEAVMTSQAMLWKKEPRIAANQNLHLLDAANTSHLNSRYLHAAADLRALASIVEALGDEETRVLQYP